MSLYGLPNAGSTSIAMLHWAIAWSVWPWKDSAQPRNVCASAVGWMSIERRYSSTASSSRPLICAR